MGPRLSRLPGWESRLAAVVEAARRRPFAWGAHDCALFAGEAVLALTGVDPTLRFRGRYGDAAGARALLREQGGPKAAGAGYGTPIPVSFAMRGDVVLVDRGNHWPAFAVCVGANCAAVGRRGLVFWPMSQTLAAWRVGG